jgi:hypothetical protein
MGRGARENDDEHLMWMGRLQWNFCGRELAFTGSDIGRRADAAGLIAVAAATNRSRYTRFSQDGGGQLEGFEEGDPGQYRVNQALVETAFMHRGFSWQQELHWKRIEDRINGTATTLVGSYVQLGYFPHGLVSGVPDPLELALRYSIYDPDRDADGVLEHELSIAANWFFKGHLAKLTAEGAWLAFDDPENTAVQGWRVRLQLDVSL